MKKKKALWAFLVLTVILAGWGVASFLLRDGESVAAKIAAFSPAPEKEAAAIAVLPDENTAASRAKVEDGYFIVAHEEAEATVASAGTIYMAENLTSDLNVVLHNILTWSKAESDSVFSEAILAKAGGDEADWYAMSVGRFGYRDTYERYLTALKNTVEEQYREHGGLDSTNAVDYQRIALTVLSLGGDPMSFGKDKEGNNINLVADGVYNPLTGTPWNQGVQGAAYALLLLDAKPFSAPGGAVYDRRDLIDHLLSRELADGGFTRAGRNPDPETTALVLTALAPYAQASAVDAVIKRALSVLSGLQRDDGGFAAANVANSISTASVLTALSALKIDPLTATDFIKERKTVLDALYGYYSVNDGAFEMWQGAGADYTATDRCFLALVAYYRFVEGYTAYYDMSGATPAPPDIHVPADNDGIAKLDAEILESAMPLKVRIKDEGTVAQLAKRYRALSVSDQAKVTHGDDLLLSEKIIAGLKKNIVIKDVFTLLAATDNEYIVSGTVDGKYPYTIIFYGDSVSKPMDFDARILTTPKSKKEIDLRAKNPIYLYFPHEGDFPGKASVEIRLGGSGAYMLYYFNRSNGNFSFLKKVVLGGPIGFDINCGGDYFLSQKQVNKLRAVYGRGDFEGGIVPKAVFESIQGENVNLELEGETEGGMTYKITFNGKDIREPMDFNCNMSLTAETEEFIVQLAEEPLILHFEHEGVMPGQAMVELAGVDLPDQDTLLFFYNDEEMRADYVQRLAILKSDTRFLIDHGGDYFIAQRAKAKSLLDTESSDETQQAPAENEPERTIPPWLPTAAGGLLALLAAAFIFITVKEKKKKALKGEKK